MKSLSENVEMYLETIYVLTEHGGRARTTDIATGWNVAPSSATEMIQRLAERGYVHHEPYRGVELTEKGRVVAKRVVRKHRLLEVFLAREVKMEGDDVSTYACEMEHVLPEAVEAWMCNLLGHPTTNPYGAPIPTGKCCEAAGVAERPTPTPGPKGAHTPIAPSGHRAHR